MNDGRHESLTPPPALTWTHLLPAGSTYDCTSGPDWFRALLRKGSGHDASSAQIVWEDADAPDRAMAHHAFVAVNCRRVTEASLRQAGFAYARHFAVLPNLAEARWFVPLDSPTVSSAALALYTPSRTSAKLKRLAARAAMRARLPVWYRDHIWVASRELPPLESALRPLFPGVDVRIALSSGAPEGARNRKASAMVIGPGGQMLAFAKLARSPIARRIAANESAVLARLARLRGVAALVPRVLLDQVIDGTRVMAQTPLEGRVAPVGITPAHSAFLDALQTDVCVPAAQTTTVADLGDRIRALPTPRPDLLAIFDGVLPTLRQFSVPVTVIHGDFAPWNLRLHDGRLGAFDWEYGELRGLPLIDEIHYRLQVGWLLEDWGTDAADHCLRELATARPLGLRYDQVRAIEVVYLLDALARLLGEGYTDDQDVIAWHRQLLDRTAPPVSTSAPSRAMSSIREAAVA